MTSIDKIGFQKPFLKWVGGKSQLLNTILKYIPKQFNNYHEPFLGGGSMLFAILTLHKNHLINIQGEIYAYDLNKNLINLYKDIQTNKDQLFACISKFINEYDSISGTVINRKATTLDEALSSKESYYYYLRQMYNKNNPDSSTVLMSALFIILNKLCFRGLYRTGPNGFNVPYGHYKKTPSIIKKEDLYTISNLIQNVHFICADYNKSFASFQENDFVYLDPPYVPENSTSFVNYNVGGFDMNEHINLFNKIKTLSNINFILSNSNVPIVNNNFKDYEIHAIDAKRRINSKNPNSTTTEVLILNKN